MTALAFLLTPLSMLLDLIKRYPRVVAVAVAVIAAWWWHTGAVEQARLEGRQQLQQEQAAEAERRHDEAKRRSADSDACQRDPTCRMQDDGFRRD